MRPGIFDDVFLSIEKVGDYKDIKKFDYDSQVYVCACRFNASRRRNSGRRLSVHAMKDKKGNRFFRVFLIEKNEE